MAWTVEQFLASRDVAGTVLSAELLKDVCSRLLGLEAAMRSAREAYAELGDLLAAIRHEEIREQYLAILDDGNEIGTTA